MDDAAESTKAGSGASGCRTCGSSGGTSRTRGRGPAPRGSGYVARTASASATRRDSPVVGPGRRPRPRDSAVGPGAKGMALRSRPDTPVRWTAIEKPKRIKGAKACPPACCIVATNSDLVWRLRLERPNVSAGSPSLNPSDRGRSGLGGMAPQKMNFRPNCACLGSRLASSPARRRGEADSPDDLGRVLVRGASSVMASRVHGRVDAQEVVVVESVEHFEPQLGAQPPAQLATFL